MRYADDSCRSALLQRLLPLRERGPYSAALDIRFASETQPDPNPLPPYVRAANFDGDRQLVARGRCCCLPLPVRHFRRRSVSGGRG
jgi:hypothetical protein